MRILHCLFVEPNVYCVCLATNLAAFFLFGLDKFKARRGHRRIPEKWLVGIAIPLSCPGAWLGVKLFRHKTRKPSFLWRLVILTILQVGLVGWALGRYGLPTF